MKKGAPPIKPTPGKTPKRTGAGASQGRRREKVRALINRMKQRGGAWRGKSGLRKRLRKRKTALAFSAGVMGISTAAMVPTQGQTPAPISQSLPIDTRQPANLLKVSDTMKEALIEEEGVRQRVYRDVAGYPTVGVGHLVKKEDGLKVGDRVSYDRILDFLDEDLRTAERGVKRLVGDLPLFQHEFDALVDLVYNVGEGNVSPDESPDLNRAIAMRDYEGIARQLDYHHAGGAVAKGLVYRSERRTNMFMEASYENPRPGAQVDTVQS